MEPEQQELDAAAPVTDRGFENIGCALLQASGVAALLIALIAGFGFPILTLIVFPFAFLVALLLGVAIGLPLFSLATALRQANPVSAALGGFLTGGAFPIVSLIAGNGQAWVALLQFGVAGAVGGLVFWFGLFRPETYRWP